MTRTYKLHRNVILLSTLFMLLLFVGHASAAFRHGIPADGNWRFKLDLDPFAEGSRFRYCEHNCGNADLRHGDFNDQASSFTICNRSGRLIGLRVRFWRHVGYNHLVFSDIIEVDDEACYVGNMPAAVDNDISSYQIRQLY